MLLVTCFLLLVFSFFLQIAIFRSCSASRNFLNNICCLIISDNQQLIDKYERGGYVAEAVPGQCHQPAGRPEGVQQDPGGQADPGQSA